MSEGVGRKGNMLNKVVEVRRRRREEELVGQSKWMLKSPEMTRLGEESTERWSRREKSERKLGTESEGGR